MRPATLLIAQLLALSISVLNASASDRGNWLGEMPTDIVNDPSCPVRLVRAGVKDKANVSKGGQVISALGSPSDRDYDPEAQTVWLSARWENLGKAALIAIEVEWAAFNSFDERLGERRFTYSPKKALKPGKKTGFGQSAPRISDDAARYETSIVRLRFDDGTTWPPPPPTPPPESEEKRESKRASPGDPP